MVAFKVITSMAGISCSLYDRCFKVYMEVAPWTTELNHSTQKRQMRSNKGKCKAIHRERSH